MAIVYVDQQGATVQKNGGQLRVMYRGQPTFTIPSNDLEQLVLQGNVQITTQAALMLLALKVDVVFTNQYGQYKGHLIGLESRYAKRRHSQLKLVEDESHALAVARAIVEGKINNQRVLLQRRVQQDPKIRNPVNGMMAMLKQCQSATSLDQLRGFEGKAAAYYFEALRVMIPDEWGFKVRAFHPPPDPVNALLSFVYTKLMRDVELKIHLVGLDAYLGVFHALGYDRPGLALDLMEEFRPILADVVSLTLISDGTISVDDFERTEDPDLPVKLARSAIKTVTLAYESRMSDRIFHPLQDGKVDYRRAIELQVRQMAQVIEGERPDYEPILIR
jgi:CRISPR-associated protein Cas1